jgi:hypothetical protein
VSNLAGHVSPASGASLGGEPGDGSGHESAISMGFLVLEGFTKPPDVTLAFERLVRERR